MNDGGPEPWREDPHGAGPDRRADGRRYTDRRRRRRAAGVGVALIIAIAAVVLIRVSWLTPAAREHLAHVVVAAVTIWSCHVWTVLATAPGSSDAAARGTQRTVRPVAGLAIVAAVFVASETLVLRHAVSVTVLLMVALSVAVGVLITVVLVMARPARWATVAGIGRSVEQMVRRSAGLLGAVLATFVIIILTEESWQTAHRLEWSIVCFIWITCISVSALSGRETQTTVSGAAAGHWPAQLTALAAVSCGAAVVFFLLGGLLVDRGIALEWIDSSQATLEAQHLGTECRPVDLSCVRPGPYAESLAKLSVVLAGLGSLASTWTRADNTAEEQDRPGAEREWIAASAVDAGHPHDPDNGPANGPGGGSDAVAGRMPRR